MAKNTKIRLNDDKVFQESNDILTLSGETKIENTILITERGSLHIHDSNTIISKNPQGDLTFEDINVGLVKLSDLLSAGESVIYQGTWDAESNNPTLLNPSGVTGQYYVVISAGTYNDIDFRERDWVISDGTKWDIVRNHAAIFFVTEEEYKDLPEEEKEDTSKIYLIEDEFFSSGVTTVSNIGVGSGLVYKEIDDGVLKLRTLNGSGSTTVVTSGDTIVISSTGNGGANILEFTITGDSVTTGFTITHNLGTRALIVQVYENTSEYSTVYVNVDRPTENTIYVSFSEAPANGFEYKILLSG